MSEDPQEIVAASESDILASDYERQAKYRTAAEAFEDAGDTARAQECRWAELAFSFSLAHRTAAHDTNKERFGPMIVRENGTGGPWIEKLPSEVWEYFAKAQCLTSNPVVRARYADLRWEGLQTYEDAQSAIDSYQEAAEVYLEYLLKEKKASVGIDLVDALLRSLELAARINDQERLVACHQAMLSTAEELISGGNPRWAYDLVWGLIENKRARQLSHFNRLKELVQKAVQMYRDSAPVNYLWERNWLKLLRRCCHLQQDKEGARTAQLAIAGTLEAEGDALCRPDGTKTLASASWYLQAIQALKQAGAPQEDINRIQRKHDQAMKDGESEYKLFSTKVEIPAEEFEKYKAWVENLADEHGLRLLGSQFWMPDVSAQETYAKESFEQYPLKRFFSEETVRDGRVAGRAITEEDKLQAETRRGMLMNLDWIGIPTIRLIIERLRQRDLLTGDEIGKVIATADAIQPERKAIIEHGFERYLEEDYLSAIHLWVFQVEGIIRDMADAMGCATTITTQNGLTQDKNLTQLLAEEVVAKTLGQDLTVLLQVVLVERAGMNVRNLVAHGLAHRDLFDQTVAEVLLSILMALANFRADGVPNDLVD